MWTGKYIRQPSKHNFHISLINISPWMIFIPEFCLSCHIFPLEYAKKEYNNMYFYQLIQIQLSKLFSKSNMKVMSSNILQLTILQSTAETPVYFSILAICILYFTAFCILLLICKQMKLFFILKPCIAHIAHYIALNHNITCCKWTCSHICSC